MELSILTINLLLVTVNCFYMEIPNDLSVTTGNSFTLTCTSSHDWEYCRFKSPLGDSCDFEWKYKKGNVSRTSCAGLEDRAVFSGDYGKKECGLRVMMAREEDTGQWECELEKYVLGLSRGAGTIRIGEFEVDVRPETTTTTTTSTVTPRTLARGSRHLVLTEEEEEEDDKFVMLSSSSIDFSQAMPLTIALTSAVMLGMIVLTVCLTVKHRRRMEKQGQYSINEDKKIIRVDYDDDVLTTSTEVEDDPDQLKTVFPHLISLPKCEAPNPGPGLVGLGFD